MRGRFFCSLLWWIHMVGVTWDFTIYELYYRELLNYSKIPSMCPLIMVAAAPTCPCKPLDIFEPENITWLFMWHADRMAIWHADRPSQGSGGMIYNSILEIKQFIEVKCEIAESSAIQLNLAFYTSGLFVIFLSNQMLLYFRV